MATAPPGNPPPEPETFTYFIETELTNLSGFSIINGDDFSSITGEEAFDYINSCASGDKFSVDLTFKLRITGSVSGITYSPLPIMEFPSNIDDINIEKISDSSIKISGSTTKRFNEVYEFVFEDGHTEILTSDTNKQFKALVRYSMPSPIKITVEYPFLLDTSPSDLNGVKVIKQFSYWTIGGTIDKIQSLVERGI